MVSNFFLTQNLASLTNAPRLAILGLTYQYTSSRISRDIYERNHSLYHDEVVRLNPPGPQNAFQANGITTITPDDTSIRATEELRFTLFRHWTLYDAMYHSSYVNSKLGIWKEKGRKRLTGLLAKMGFAQAETQQSYSHMSLAVKNNLVHQLESIAPEYAMTELNYPSFVRARGWKGQGMSAADEVDVLATIMDVAYGYKMEVEIEGGRNGGEWFGGGKVWEGRQASRLTHRKDHERENIPPGDASNRARQKSSTEDGVEVDEPPEGSKQDLPWWQQNFWAAFDALSDWSQLNRALPLCISLHRAIIRQGTSVIDKHLIKTMRSHRVVILSQGPDLALFSNPGPLSRLALWLVDALRDRVGNAPNARGRARKSLPFVVACLNEETETFIVVGIMAAKEFGDVSRKCVFLPFIVVCDTNNLSPASLVWPSSTLKIAAMHVRSMCLLTPVFWRSTRETSTSSWRLCVMVQRDDSSLTLALPHCRLRHVLPLLYVITFMEPLFHCVRRHMHTARPGRPIIGRNQCTLTHALMLALHPNFGSACGVRHRFSSRLVRVARKPCAEPSAYRSPKIENTH